MPSRIAIRLPHLTRDRYASATARCAATRRVGRLAPAAMQCAALATLAVLVSAAPQPAAGQPPANSTSADDAPAAIAPAYGIEQPPEPEGIELLQSEPYDLIWIKSSAGGGWVKVRPLDLPGRKVPSDPAGTLGVEVLSLPGKPYEIAWSNIERIELWEDRLQQEAQRRIAAGDFAGAYPFLAVLMRDYPNTPGLRQTRSEFLFRDAAAHFQKGEFKATLAVLEELRRFAPDYQANTVLRVIGQVTDSLMGDMLQRGRLEDAQKLLARLKNDYTADQVSSIKTWDDRFLQLAQTKKEEAIAARDAADYRKARQLALDSLHIYPSIPGSRELVRQIDQLYPLVNVGVLQRATVLDPTRIDNWPARRAGALVFQVLFAMRGAGPDGGEYDFLFGRATQSDDRLQLTLELQPEKLDPPLSEVDAYTVADALAARAQRSSPSYSPAWASVVEAIAVPGPQSVQCLLRRPHVLPSSLLQLTVDGRWIGADADTPTGPYRLDVREEDRTRYVLNRTAAEQAATSGSTAPETTASAAAGVASSTGVQPREIVEVDTPNAADAIEALLRGDVDVVDRLFPADAHRLRRSSAVRVAHYPLPSVHMLIPCSDHVFLQERTFRRALIYATHRQDILAGELLEGQQIEGCRVVSGPFPAGIGPDDPLAYAYDESVQPRPYEPTLAKFLVELTVQQLKTAADKKKEKPPELTPIRLAVPADNIAAIAAEAIKAQWELVGLQVEIVPLPPGRSMPEAGEADLVYVTAAVWEPTIDARRVLGPDGLAQSQDQLIGLALRSLESSRSWREVRDRLHVLHRTAYDELPILPLWQLVDSYAYRRDLSGVGNNIVSLYQNVHLWRLSF